MLKDLPTNTLHLTSMAWHQVCQLLLLQFSLNSRSLPHFLLWATKYIFLSWYFSYISSFLVAFENIIISERRVVSVICSGNFRCFPKPTLSCQSGATFHIFDIPSFFRHFVPPFHPVFTDFIYFFGWYCLSCMFSFYCHCNCYKHIMMASSVTTRWSESFVTPT